MMNRNIIAFDLGNKMGMARISCEGVIDTKLIKSPVKKAKSDDKKYYLGDVERLSFFYNELENLFYQKPFSIVFFEEVQTLHMSLRASAVYFGLRAVLLLFCAQRNIEVHGISVGTIKKFATGKGNAKKDKMIIAAVLDGIDTTDDNVADAYHILQCGINLFLSKDKVLNPLKS